MSPFQVKVMYLPGQFCGRKKKLLKTIFKASVFLFHVKVWMEKCQDVTNERKW